MMKRRRDERGAANLILILYLAPLAALVFLCLFIIMIVPGGSDGGENGVEGGGGEPGTEQFATNNYVDENGRALPPPTDSSMKVYAKGGGSVNYNGHHVSDPVIHQILQMIGDLFGKQLCVGSGDRIGQNLFGNTKSHHNTGNAADFHVGWCGPRQPYGPGGPDGPFYLQIKASRILEGRSIQLVWHYNKCNHASAPHLHIGHYVSGKPTNYRRDLGGYGSKDNKGGDFYVTDP